MHARAPTQRRGGSPRAQTRPTRATRLLHPDGLTRPEYQLTRPMWLTMILMTSTWCNCDVSMHSRHVRMTSAWCNCDIIMYSRHVMSAPSQMPRPHSGATCQVICRKPSRAGSRGIGSSVANRSSDHNCFDQILSIWNVIWMISDLFPANLIVPDAMVRSDRWELKSKVVVVNY